MVELYRPTALQVCLLLLLVGRAVQICGSRYRSRGLRIARRLLRVVRVGSALRRRATLLTSTRTLERCDVTLIHKRRRTEVRFRALDAVLWLLGRRLLLLLLLLRLLLLLLPIVSALRKERLRSTVRVWVAFNLRSSASNGLNSCAHRGGDPDGVRVVASTAFNPVAWWQEGIEALD